jgi:hypothetical protein
MRTCESVMIALRPARIRDRDGGCVGELVGEVLWSDKAEADDALQTGDRLRRVTAFGAGSDVGRGGGCEAQPAAWAANVGHGSGSHSVFPRQAVPARWAYAIHHRVTQPLVGKLEVHPVASQARHMENVPALGAAIGPSCIQPG